MDTAILIEPQSECKSQPIEKLEYILAELTDSEQVVIWREMALDFGARLRQREAT